MDFKELKITAQFIKALDKLGFNQPTPIQEKAIPSINSGQDVIGVAQTGTGKTLAYLLPIVSKIKYSQNSAATALVVLPTKELALQVEESALQIVEFTDIKIVSLYGGIGPKDQIKMLENGADIIITTPGRFMELYLKGYIELKKIKFFVLDEADRMMDMGFFYQVKKFLEVLPRKRQNLLFSATFNEKVEILSEEFLEFPLKIEISPSATPAVTVLQQFYNVPNFKTKLKLLEHLLLDKEIFSRVIVFCKTKESANLIFAYLERKIVGGIKVIHSNKGQSSRINAMNEFKAGEIRLLVATDVAARGIDVTDVSHVINFNTPQDHEEYVHRIGRTGRANKTGISITFTDRAEVFYLKSIKTKLGIKIQEQKLDKLLIIDEYLPYEIKDMDREIDYQKKNADPTFRGAFHDRKKKKTQKQKKIGAFSNTKKFK
jgi:ATP-dependent RNA helicase RhlE